MAKEQISPANTPLSPPCASRTVSVSRADRVELMALSAQLRRDGLARGESREQRLRLGYLRHFRRRRKAFERGREDGVGFDGAAESGDCRASAPDRHRGREAASHAQLRLARGALSGQALPIERRDARDACEHQRTGSGGLPGLPLQPL